MIDSGQFQFAEPGWLWLAGLGPLALLILQRWAARTRGRRLALVAAPHALAQLTRSHSPLRRHLKDGLLLLALFLTGVTLARPQWGRLELRDQWLAEDVVFVLDCSRSMLATDVAPNRLQRAKYAIMNFVQRQASGRVGLVAFAGSAFLQCPLTFDYDAFEDSLRDLDERAIPVGGTDIGRALGEAIKAMDAKSRHKLVVLITDGEDLEKSGVKSAEALAKDGAAIYTIGVGTEAGAELRAMNPAGQMDVVRDAKGEAVRSRLDEAVLKQIATAGGGSYFVLGRLGEGLTRVRLHMQASHAANLARTRSEAIDRYYLPLALVVWLLITESLIGTRRRMVAERTMEVATVSLKMRRALLVGSLLCLGGAISVAATNEATNIVAKLPVPRTAQDFYNAGTRQLAKAKLEEAESLLRAALARQEDRVAPLALYNLGQVRFQQGAAELKKAPDESQMARRIQNAEQLAGAASASAQSALAANDLDQMIDAYQRGRGARREVKAARTAIKQALESYAKTMERWQRALGDFRSTVELHPEDANAKENVKRVEQAIAELIDRARKLMQMIMANAAGPKPKFDEMMKQLKGRIPEDKMPPGAPGDDEEEDGGISLEQLRNQMESPSKEGEERDLPLSPEDAGKLLDGFKLDGNRRLPMSSPSDKLGSPKDRKLRDW